MSSIIRLQRVATIFIWSLLSSVSTLPDVDAAFVSINSPSTSCRINKMNQCNSKFMGRGMALQPATFPRKNNNMRGSMRMFLGADGILGVGAPEIAVTLLVGYFILGPSDLYKLTKEVGKTIQSFRTLSSEASKSFESTMEDQLDLQELRKAQSELNDAFSFRRSINVNQDDAAFSELPPMAQTAEEGTAVAATATASTSDGTQKKKKKRRRVKKKKVQPIEDEPFVGDIPDLDIDFSEEFKQEMKDQMMTGGIKEKEMDDAERQRNERLDRLQNGQPSNPPDWYTASETDVENEVMSQQISQPSPAEVAAEQNRFASQLSGNWNDQVLANEDKLSPLAKVMERLAILEEERNASDARLEEEFRLRAENEEKFYRQKRKVLEEASAEIAASTYNFDVAEEDKPEVNVNATTATSNITKVWV